MSSDGVTGERLVVRIWVVTEIGSDYYSIRAICTHEELAEIYRKYLLRNAKEWGREIMVDVEHLMLDHLFGAERQPNYLEDRKKVIAKIEEIRKKWKETDDALRKLKARGSDD